MDTLFTLTYTLFPVSRSLKSDVVYLSSWCSGETGTSTCTCLGRSSGNPHFLIFSCFHVFSLFSRPRLINSYRFSNYHFPTEIVFYSFSPKKFQISSLSLSNTLPTSPITLHLLFFHGLFLVLFSSDPSILCSISITAWLIDWLFLVLLSIVSLIDWSID